jgi:hypothetical protein
VSLVASGKSLGNGWQATYPISGFGQQAVGLGKQALGHGLRQSLNFLVFLLKGLGTFFGVFQIRSWRWKQPN